MRSSSSSKRRASAMRGTLLRGAELRYLPFDFRLDVQRGLPLLGAADVAGDDHVADLLAQRRVDAGRGEALQLGLDVERLLAAPGAAGVRGLEQLADLLLLLGLRGRAGRHGVGRKRVALVPQ